MNNYGYIKVAAAIPSVRVGDCNYNVSEIEKMIISAEGAGVEIIVFPELSTPSNTINLLCIKPLVFQKYRKGCICMQPR